MDFRIYIIELKLLIIDNMPIPLMFALFPTHPTSPFQTNCIVDNSEKGKLIQNYQFDHVVILKLLLAISHFKVLMPTNWVFFKLSIAYCVNSSRYY